MDKVVVGSCPLRVSFLGGGTDLPTVMDNLPGKRGMVLATPINKFVHAQALVGSTKVEDVQLDPRIDTPLTRAVLTEFRGWDDKVPISSLTMMSDLPVIGTGLGGSAAWISAMADAIQKARKSDGFRMIDSGKSYKIERSIGSSCGFQDHAIAQYRRPMLAAFYRSNYDADLIHSHRIYCPQLLNIPMALFYVGGQRDGNDILNRVGKIEYDVSDMIRLLEKGYTALQFGDHATFGECVRHSWKIKRSLDSAISNDHIDEVIRTAIGAGAYGAKLLGAGGAGFVLTIGNSGSVIDAVTKAHPEVKHCRFSAYDEKPE